MNKNFNYNLTGFRQHCTQWYLDLVGEEDNAKVPGGVPPPGGQSDHGYDDDTWGGQRVGISPGGGDTVSLRTTPHNGLH